MGLVALKNISIAMDYYDDRDVYNYDTLNGSVHLVAFWVHRTVYETATSTLESVAVALCAYFIMGCSTAPGRPQTIVTFIVAYYNCIVAMFTLVYGTRLGRPEARSIAFFTQAVIAIASGLWIKRGDTAVFDLLWWLQYISPTYWTLSPLIRANMAGAGECVLLGPTGTECRASVGDLVVEQIRADRLSPDVCLACVVGLWAAFRAIQLALLVVDAHASAITGWLSGVFGAASTPDTKA
ncbi:hypothetical protein BC831DRAFT_144290 [Entophlyctis helioformis]|nr:hypothetical protein BC831DRAFT_144290 [Entophlyctis helioformis]